MGRDRRALLFDAINACREILGFVRDLNAEQYAGNLLVKYAVERQFIVIGEALNRLKQSDLEVYERIQRAGQIVGFRNILVHGYEVVSDVLVFQIVKNNLTELEETCVALLNESDDGK